jgi:trigger factor
MTDETKPDQPDTAQPEAAPPEAATAVQEPEGEPQPVKLTQTVEIKDAGPCKKHIRVAVSRADIDARRDEKFKDLAKGTSFVPGFRPGKAPRKLIERQYAKDVNEQVKNEVLLASLEQLAEDHDVAPLSPPDIDPGSIDVPKEGDLVYEFDVEVRPQFDLPQYKGLKLRRPVHTFTEEEKNAEERRLLLPHSQIVPKEGGVADVGDILVADVTVKHGDQTLSEMKEAQFRVEKQLAFKDGVAEKFADQVKGAKAGDVKEADITLSRSLTNPELRGATVKGLFAVKDVKTLRPPELTHDFLHRFGVHSPEQFRELIGVALERRLEYQQRQAIRKQVLEQIAAASTWELPEDLLMRQAKKAMARRVMEMRADGISEEEINARVRLLQQDVLRSTALALKEHFVLQKLAEVEKIEVDDDDLNAEIERLADQSGDSPRKLRARLEKEDLLDSLAAEMIERKALDLILNSAEYEDVPLGQEERAPSVATVEAQATPGELPDPTAAPPSESPANPT